MNRGIFSGCKSKLEEGVEGALLVSHVLMGMDTGVIVPISLLCILYPYLYLELGVEVGCLTLPFPPLISVFPSLSLSPSLPSFPVFFSSTPPCLHLPSHPHFLSFPSLYFPYTTVCFPTRTQLPTFLSRHNTSFSLSPFSCFSPRYQD